MTLLQALPGDALVALFVVALFLVALFAAMTASGP